MTGLIMPWATGMLSGGGGANIEFVGAAIGTTTNLVTTTNVPLTSLTGGIASSPSEGDIVIGVFGVVSANVNENMNITGFTELWDAYINSTVDSNLYVGYKIMGATPDTNMECTCGTGRYINIGIAHVWRGVDQSTPIDVSIVTASSTAPSTPPNPPSITPVTTGAVVIAVGHYAEYDGDQLSAPELENFTEEFGPGGIRGAALAVGSLPWTGGALDPAVFTYAGGISSGHSWAAASLALRPA